MQNVQQMVQSAFFAHGFRVQWWSALHGRAERGDSGANVLLGAMAQYYAVDFEIYPTLEAATVRLRKANTGWAGGIIGAASVDQQFDSIANTLAGWFHAQGALQGFQKF